MCVESVCRECGGGGRERGCVWEEREGVCGKRERVCGGERDGVCGGESVCVHEEACGVPLHTTHTHNTTRNNTYTHIHTLLNTHTHTHLGIHTNTHCFINIAFLIHINVTNAISMPQHWYLGVVLDMRHLRVVRVDV